MTRTLTALFDSRDDAERAQTQLQQAGVNQVQITAQQQDRSSGSSDGDSGGFFSGLKDFFMGEDDRHAYAEGVRRGGFLLTARTDEQRVDRACDILENSGAVDFDERQQQWRADGWDGRAQPWTGSGTPREGTEPSSFNPGQSAMSGEREERIPIVEEELRVGKRETERGSVRVRSYVEETPVQEQVSLHEEHVEMERRDVGERLARGDADELFQERTVEMTERAEEAVVGKEAFVREEVTLRKQASDRTETIEDTVRKTKVDVDDSRSDGMDSGRRSVSGERQGMTASSGPGAFGGPQVGGEHPSFASGDSSIAMGGEDTVLETEEERRRRNERDPQDRQPTR